MERTNQCWILAVMRATESWAFHRHRRGQGSSPTPLWIFSGPFSRYFLSSSLNCDRGSLNGNWSQSAVQMHEFCVFSSQKEQQTKPERKRAQSLLNTVTMLLVEFKFRCFIWVHVNRSLRFDYIQRETIPPGPGAVRFVQTRSLRRGQGQAWEITGQCCGPSS